MADDKLREGILFWTLHWATSAIKDDPEQIINYYTALRELWPLCSEYDRTSLRHSLRQKLNELTHTYPNNQIVTYHVSLILHLIGKE